MPCAWARPAGRLVHLLHRSLVGVASLTRPLVCSIAARPFLDELLQRVDVMIASANARPSAVPRHARGPYFPPSSHAAKLCVYAAHDTTLLVLMIALGLPVDHLPRYAATLSAELYRLPTGEYAVQFLYDDKPVALPCAKGATLCPLPVFRAFVDALYAHDEHQQHARKP